MLPLFFIEKCASTQDEIINFIGDFPEGLGIVTFCQVNGRGQYGNSWETSENENIAYSFALKSSAVSLSHIVFNFYTAVILRDFLAKLTNFDVEIKWPNDLIIKGRKISGMLLEKRRIKEVDYFIVGIGINMLQKNFGTLSSAGSVFTQTQLRFDLQDFSKKLNEEFSSKILQPLSSEIIVDEVNNHLFRKDKVSVFEIAGLRQNGIIQKADTEGFLWIELEESGLQKFFHKQIQLLY